MIHRRFPAVLLFTAVLILSQARAFAGPEIRTAVKIILASQGNEQSDPRLGGLIKELQTLFRYSSYRLIDQKSMNLGIGQTGKAVLPGSRMLHITPQKISGDRVTLQLEIFRKKRQIFQTIVQLLNNGSMTVGGPRHEGGYLLFNIASSF